jgi:superfamily I DNA and/or RNA helicase
VVTKPADWNITDELGGSTEPNATVSIPKGKRFVGFGDDKQTRPFARAQGHKLNVSAMQRLRKLQGAIFLNVQFRSHPEIAEFSSAEFYDKQLLSSPVAPAGGRYFPEHRCLFINLKDEEEVLMQSAAERNKLYELLTAAVAAGYLFRDIGIISVYGSQAGAVKAEIG